MKIYQITENKKDYLELLLLADEQESMIDKYLDCGDMFVLDDGGVKAECVVVTLNGENEFELKNIAVYPDAQRKGYGKKLIHFLFEHYKGGLMYVGTGDSPLTLNFYESCGFKESHRVKNFFTDNYDHPMFECGKQLVDMVYLKREW